MKKSVIVIILLAFTSSILTTASPLQIAYNLVENNGYFYIKNVGQKVYADDDDDDDIGDYNKKADKEHD